MIVKAVEKPKNIMPVIVGLDPSSSVIGYAVLDQRDGRILDAGLIKPNRTDDEPLTRIAAMLIDLGGLFEECRPAAVVLEVTSGKVGQRHKGEGAGLAVYGMGVGAVWQFCQSRGERDGFTVVSVLENDWTGGRPKTARLAVLAATEPKYKTALDPGGDVGDAIGLGRYYLAGRQAEAGQHD